MNIQFSIMSEKRPEIVSCQVDNVFIIGYSGRNMEETRMHIQELQEKLGVEPPTKIPTIFQCSTALLTQERSIQVLGAHTSGEVEYVIILKDNDIYITIGSDHTDRDLESVSVAKAKQICAKALARQAWRYEELADHFDKIELTSWQEVEEQRIPYQKGTLASILSIEQILQECLERIGSPANDIIFCGTVPLLKDFIYGNRFHCEMYDPVLNRKLEFSYAIKTIPEEER